MHSREGGFTLVELMTVVAIIGLLAGLGIVFLDSDNKGRSAQGYSEALEAQYELARARAVASQKRQRIDITADGFSHWQYVTEGLGEDSANLFSAGASWDFVYKADVPEGVTIDHVDAALHFDPNIADSATMAFTATIDVLPDGRARSDGSTNFFEPGWTVFIGDNETATAGTERRVRTLLFAVTGTASTVPGW